MSRVCGIIGDVNGLIKMVSELNAQLRDELAREKQGNFYYWSEGRDLFVNRRAKLERGLEEYKICDDIVDLYH